MNITITQDNSRIETLGSNGASIIQKLYELAIDSNNTLTLRGNISSASGYEDAVNYLNATYNPDFTVSASKLYMRFEDANVQSICVQKWGDGVGVSKQEIQSVQTIGNTFEQNDDIKTFNELKYFRITYLENTAFGGCDNLEEITLPSSVTTVGDAAFSTVSLKKINNVENIVTVGLRTFGVYDGESSKLMNNDAFYLKSLTTLNGRDVFSNCNFAQVYMPSLITSYVDGFYDNWWSNWGSFAGEHNHRFTCGLMYFKNLTKMYPATFVHITCTALVINNTTPPVWANQNDITDEESSESTSKNVMFEGSSFGGSGLRIVYVPDSAISTYQSDAMWGAQCTFKGISELNNGVIYNTYEDWVEAEKPVGLIAEYLGLSAEDLTAFVTAHNLTYWTNSNS